MAHVFFSARVINPLARGVAGRHRHGSAGRAELGIHENMVRLSVGLEDVEDLKEDIAAALEA